MILRRFRPCNQSEAHLFMLFLPALLTFQILRYLHSSSGCCLSIIPGLPLQLCLPLPDGSSPLVFALLPFPFSSSML